MSSVYDQYSTSTSSRTNSINRPSIVPISALLNPEPDNVSSTTSTNNVDNYENLDDGYYNSTSSQNVQNGQCRRYSAPNLSSADVSNNNLTIIYHNNNSSNSITPINSDSSISTPTSPMSKHSTYLGGGSSRSTSSSVPSTRRSSMNRSSDHNSINNMITPPQTPGIKSPTKSNFQFPPNASDQNSQSMPPKVKRKRITQEQLADLVAMFEQTDTPSYDVREKLAKKLNMTNREVQVWFQNRRAKANRAKANEHNASHQHHRFLHHHSVSTAQAASGHASSIGMINPGNFTFVPMFTNGGPSASCPAKGRNNRRHSCVTSTINSQKKASQNSPFTRQRAATVTGAPMTSHNSSSNQKMVIPPSIKILPSYGQDLHPTHHVYGGHGHTVPHSPVSPISPSNTAPILPPPIPSSHYMLPGLNPCNLPPPIPPIKELLPPPSDLYPSSQHSLTPIHHPQSYNNQPLHSFSSNVETQSTLSPVVSKTSPIDILATAAEFVQSEEKEKERLRALEAMKQDDENNDDSQKSSVWRPWLV
ncbi:hypothetical protein C2G38_2230065 [Gigaspora rosea]|uniref:Homeobox domain-containing protein n=1 Tax=Gigaspora rosea TaxID=44941 RepID=A0A397U3P7_9GLOM|nr:hypothetical protein C2G38_2230065 [Gigaspora rosea]